MDNVSGRLMTPMISRLCVHIIIPKCFKKQLKVSGSILYFDVTLDADIIRLHNLFKMFFSSIKSNV